MNVIYKKEDTSFVKKEGRKGNHTPGQWIRLMKELDIRAIYIDIILLHVLDEVGRHILCVSVQTSGVFIEYL